MEECRNRKGMEGMEEWGSGGMEKKKEGNKRSSLGTRFCTERLSRCNTKDITEETEKLCQRIK